MHVKKSLPADTIFRAVEYDIIVVDNNSEDGSVEFLKNYFPKTVLMENKTNVGFSKANNQGSKLANGRYLLFFELRYTCL